MYGLIGCRAHDYGKASMSGLAAKIKADGYLTMQLALKKSLPEVDDLKNFLSEKNADDIAKCLHDAGLEVSVLGAYLNYAGLDDSIRDENIEVLKGHIKIAKSMGARMVGTETGSLNDDYSVHNDNPSELAFERFKDALLKVLPLVESEDTYLAVEAVSHHVIHTPSRMFRLIQEIHNERLKVIFDISNLMTWDNYKEQDQLMKEMFELMEEQIWVVHVKDFDFVDTKKVIVPLGAGRLNVELLLELVKKSSSKVDVIAEDVSKQMLQATYLKLKTYME